MPKRPIFLFTGDGRASAPQEFNSFEEAISAIDLGVYKYAKVSDNPLISIEEFICRYGQH